MPNIAVVDMEGKKVGTVDLSDSIFAIEPNAAVMHQVVLSYLAAQRQGTPVAPEGHRPRKTGLDTRSPVDTRRRCFRSQAQRLQVHRQQEGEKTGYEVGAFRKGCGERHHRG